MRTRKAFTLIEMLAVIGIMLVLMVAAFGAFSLFAERIGPDEAQVTLQGVINGARAYAASNGVRVRIELAFSLVKDSKGGGTGVAVQDGTVLVLKYLLPGGNRETLTAWTDIPGANRVALGSGIFVIKGIPDMTNSAQSKPKTVGADQVEAWRNYDKKALEDVSKAVTTFLGQVKLTTPSYIEFDPLGNLVESTSNSGFSPVNGVTIVQLVGGNIAAGQSTARVSQYRFFVLNAYSGTRLVFD